MTEIFPSTISAIKIPLSMYQIRDFRGWPLTKCSPCHPILDLSSGLFPDSLNGTFHRLRSFLFKERLGMSIAN